MKPRGTPRTVVCGSCGEEFTAFRKSRKYCSMRCSGVASPHPTTDPVPRFWKKVDRRGDGECWEWLGARHPSGHGIFQGAGLTYAHRFSWTLANGPIPAGRWSICHHCDNPPCVNPAHLYLGTQSENTADAYRRNRRGSREQRVAALRGKGSRLTPEIVREIRVLRSGGALHREIADRFQMKRSTVAAILCGQTWAWVK